MDRYNGYVSNHDLYNGRGMASQTRYMSGPGGAVVSNQYKPMNMPPTKSSCESGCTPFRRYSGYDGGYNNDPIKPVVYEQPRPTHREVKKALFSHDGRDWTTGVCGCFEHGASCVCAFCCTCCFACYVSNKMNENTCGPLVADWFCPAMRTRMRGVYGIEGSLCKDCCVTVCCACCMVAQLYREIRNNNDD